MVEVCFCWSRIVSSIQYTCLEIRNTNLTFSFHSIRLRRFKISDVSIENIEEFRSFSVRKSSNAVSILRHNGSHPAWNKYVGRVLDGIRDDPEYDPSMAKRKLDALVNSLTKIVNISDKKIELIGKELLENLEKKKI